MAALKYEYRAKVIRNIVLSALFVLLIIAADVAVSVYFSPYMNLLSVPAIIVFCVRELGFISKMLEILKLLSADYDNYSVWMDMQLKKEYGGKSTDLSNAEQFYRLYIDGIQNNLDKIRVNLKNELAGKEGRQITVSVLCGLIFLSGIPQAGEILFDAKYKHGEAGNMIPAIWILCLDNRLPEKMNKQALETEFRSFWDNSFARGSHPGEHG